MSEAVKELADQYIREDGSAPDLAGANRLPVLAAEIRKEIEEEAATAKLIGEHVSKAAEHMRDADALREVAIKKAIRIGTLLIEVKKLAGHGNWLAWLRDNCKLEERTAQNYMRLVKIEEAAPNTKPVSDLGLGIKATLRAAAKPHLKLVQRPADTAPQRDAVKSSAAADFIAACQTIIDTIDAETVNDICADVRGRKLKVARVAKSSIDLFIETSGGLEYPWMTNEYDRRQYFRIVLTSILNHTPQSERLTLLDRIDEDYKKIVDEYVQEAVTAPAQTETPPTR